MSNKIYIVTEGCYDEYRVVAAFTSEEKARKYMDEFDFDLEEVELDPAPLIQEGDYKFYHFIMYKYGAVHGIDVSVFKKKIFQEEKIKLDVFAGLACLQCGIKALTKDRALEIANVKRLELIASGEWK